MNKLNIFFKIYTYDNHDQLIKKIKKYKYLRENYSISSIEYHKVQEFISSVDLVIFFLKENYSIKASFQLDSPFAFSFDPIGYGFLYT